MYPSLCVGVDVGNYDTKTKHTSTVSGYIRCDTPQLLATSVIKYKGKYYVESAKDRFPYAEDKTIDSHCLILTLFGIAKEIIWRLQNEKHIAGNLQNEIREINTVHLSIGLPPGHFNKYAASTVAFYKAQLKDIVEFEYQGYTFKFKLGNVNAYAQDLSAVVMDDNVQIKAYNNYLIVGIGGGTVDIIPISDGGPEPENCRSLSMGTRPMFETIIARVQTSTDMMGNLTERAIEDVLRGNANLVPDDVKEEINRNVTIYADQLLDKLIQSGYNISLTPIVFVGGGCLLLKSALESNPKIKKCEFIEDVHANAAAYEEYQKQSMGLVE